MSATAVVALALSACSTPAFEFERVTVTNASYDNPLAAIVAVPADLAIVSASEDFERTRAVAGPPRMRSFTSQST
ncbi:hypothetical protein [Mesorhizobium sp. M0590]|uniref:hypothetical protein n=1 Tax=unclassified Mesorhizobium TaxID=325217 RepID=UPI003339013C